MDRLLAANPKEREDDRTRQKRPNSEFWLLTPEFCKGVYEND